MDQKSSRLKRSWVLLRKNPAGLFLAAAWPYLGVFASAAIARVFVLRYSDLDGLPMEPLTLWNSLGWLSRVGFLLSYFFCTTVSQSLAVAGVSVVTWENCLGGNSTVLHGFAGIRRRLFPLIALSFFVGFWATLVASVVPVAGPFIVHTVFLPSAVVVLMLEKPQLRVLRAFQASLGLTADSIATIFGAVVVFVGTFVGLSVVLIRLRMSSSVSPVFFTFANLTSFLLVLPSAVALFLGVALTSSYYDRRCRATAPGAVT